MRRQAFARFLVAAGTAALAWSGLTYASAAHRQEQATAAARVVLSSAPRGVRIQTRRAEDGDVLGLLRIPAIRVRTAFFEGVAEQTLLAGPGHLPWTAPPGSGEVSVLSAHRDMHFRDLRELERGDLVVLRLPGRRIRYSVFDSRVVRPDDISVTDPLGGEVLRLVTCWPPSFIGPAPQRLVVSAVPRHPKARSGPMEQSRTQVAAALVPAPRPNPRLVVIGALGAAIAAAASIPGSRGRRRWFVAWAGGLVVLDAALVFLNA